MTIGQLAEVTFEKGNDISDAKFAPVLDYNSGETTTFSIKNKAAYQYSAYVTLNIESIDSELQTESFKYILFESNDNSNFSICKEGNFVDFKVGQNLLATVSIPTNSIKYYKFVMYIDSNTQINVNMMEKSMVGNILVEATLPLDDSGANAPELVDGMIPVMYDGTTWVKADTEDKNGTYRWYDYDQKQWANAVLVSETNRSTYQKAEAGVEITEADVLAYYVWIPRYKYKVWNINKIIGTDSYDAYNTGIDIVFEKGKSTTGEIKCNDYSFAMATSSTPNEICIGANGEYYTHPAFTFGSDEVRGIWVGKFAVSSSDPTSSYGGAEGVDLSVRVKPNVNIWRSNYLSAYSYVIQNMQKEGNEYGLTTDKIKVDSHMMKNMEWGAMTYFSYSKYGICEDGACRDIGWNNNFNSSGYKIITGCGAASSTSLGSYYTSTDCNEYTTIDGQLASTTGNVYGIYDTGTYGGIYVMANMSSSYNSYIYNDELDEVGDYFIYSSDTAKYIDTYGYCTSSYKTQLSYNRSRLGDAIGEIVLEENEAWYARSAAFIYDDRPWLERNVLFNFYYDTGGQAGDSTNSVKAVLVSLN